MQRFKAWLASLERHHWIIIGITAALLIGGGGYWLWRITRPGHTVMRPSTKTATKPATPPKPITKISPLTGVAVAPELADRPITAVVIENQTDSRPQSGLSQAGVVYEALAEGGITRYLAFYLENKAGTLGPVRSIRTYFVDWALEFNAPVAHAGGNADALDLINPLGMKDMNEFAWGSYFYRTTDRFAPHNLYTSGDKLDALEQKLGYFKPATFTPSPRKADAPMATPTNPDIKIDYSYTGYQVEYKYDATHNDYARFLAGAPHIDRNTGQQIHAKNVVVQYMPTSFGTTRIGESTVIMGTPGSGQAVVFRDGGAATGTWTKPNHTTRTKLLDPTGAEIQLDPGNTWYSIVPIGKTATY
jgi:Protein of unknown function (DUF3048) N-terminal domain/Protein of unknown function (DUF3048) C-terminal domain